MQKLIKQCGELRSYDTGKPEEGWVCIVMDIPARGLIDYMASDSRILFTDKGGLYHAPHLSCRIQWIPQEWKMAESTAKISIPVVTDSSGILALQNWDWNAPQNAQEQNLVESHLSAK